MLVHKDGALFQNKGHNSDKRFWNSFKVNQVIHSSFMSLPSFKDRITLILAHGIRVFTVHTCENLTYPVPACGKDIDGKAAHWKTSDVTVMVK